eukprot:COSAG01_NODE_3928_length_5526_cov_8.623803_1_plen_207_part_10
MSSTVEKRPRSPIANAPTPKKHKVSDSFSAMYAATQAKAKPAKVTQTGLTIKPHARSIVVQGPSVLDTVPPKQYDMFCSTELFDTDRLLICIELADELGLKEDHIAQAKTYLKQSERSQLPVYYENEAIGLFTTKISDPALMKTEAYKTAKAALDNLDPECTPEERARLYQKVQHSQLRGALTQMNMPKLIRASICEPVYEDLDFVD